MTPHRPPTEHRTDEQIDRDNEYRASRRLAILLNIYRGEDVYIPTVDRTRLKDGHYAVWDREKLTWTLGPVGLALVRQVIDHVRDL